MAGPPLNRNVSQTIEVQQRPAVVTGERVDHSSSLTTSTPDARLRRSNQESTPARHPLGMTRWVPLAALALLALAPAAFWPGYLSRFSSADGYTHAHAALGTAWLLLLLVQPLLITASRRPSHRVVGRVGVLIGVSFVVSGVLIAHRSVARMDHEQFIREGRYVYLPLAMAVLFGVALLLAVRWRRHAPAHGRFMAATALPLLDPLFARLLAFHAPPLPAEALYQVPAFGLFVAVMVVMLVSLPVTSPARATFGAFCAVATVILAGFFAVPHVDAWQAFAAWFRALPLT